MQLATQQKTIISCAAVQPEKQKHRWLTDMSCKDRQTDKQTGKQLVIQPAGHRDEHMHRQRQTSLQSQNEL